MLCLFFLAAAASRAPAPSAAFEMFLFLFLFRFASDGYWQPQSIYRIFIRICPLIKLDF
jgi:hypothetical protein